MIYVCFGNWEAIDIVSLLPLGSKNGKAQVSDAAMPSNKESSAELSSKSADNSKPVQCEQN